MGKKQLSFHLMIDGDFLKIYINQTMHFMIKHGEIIGIRSYITDKTWYCIEYVTANKDLLCEYDDKFKWESILKLLDDAKF